MLKRTIKYENFNDEQVVEDFYFNVSKPELIDLEVEHPEGFGNWLEKIVKSKDNKQIVDLLKRLIRLGYGEKSDDGKHFIKSEALSDAFVSSAAYIALYNELIEDDSSAADFIIGMMPKDMVTAAQKAGTLPTPAASPPS